MSCVAATDMAGAAEGGVELNTPGEGGSRGKAGPDGLALCGASALDHAA